MEEVSNEVPLDTQLGDLGAKYLVEFGETVGVMDARSSENGRRRHLRLHLEGGEKHQMLDVPARRPVGDIAAAMAGLKPTRVVRLPPGRVVGRAVDALKPSGWKLAAPGLALFILAVVLPLDPWLRFTLLTISLGAIVATFTVGARPRGTKQWMFVHEGRRSTLGQLRAPPDRDAPPQVADIAELKAEYGRLLSDIAYRIEYPALFDPHEPHTKEFTLALLEWDDTHERLDDDARAALAERVAGSFAAARAHAERIGLDHFPADARERATTALKAARVAVDERAPEAERAAALSRTIRLLDALALYYLPTGLEAREAIHGRPIRQLPGRASS